MLAARQQKERVVERERERERERECMYVVLIRLFQSHCYEVKRIMSQNPTWNRNRKRKKSDDGIRFPHRPFAEKRKYLLLKERERERKKSKYYPFCLLLATQISFSNPRPPPHLENSKN